MALASATLAVVVEPASAATLSLEQWAVGYLAFIGAPAASPTDARVQFLEKWAMVEGTFYLGNVDNPLDTEYPEAGDGLWNSAGVRTYPTLAEGYQATLATMEQAFDAPILAALRNRGSSLAALTKTLGSSNWTGYGPLSSPENGYAVSVQSRAVGPTGLLGPTTPTSIGGLSLDGTTDSFGSAAIRGVVVNPLGQGLGDVCVAAIPADGLAIDGVTSPDGAFRLTSVPQTDVRLRVTDCDLAEGGAPPAYFDTGARGRDSAASYSQASVFTLDCGANCSTEHYRLRSPIV